MRSFCDGEHRGAGGPGLAPRHPLQGCGLIGSLDHYDTLVESHVRFVARDNGLTASLLGEDGLAGRREKVPVDVEPFLHEKCQNCLCDLLPRRDQPLQPVDPGGAAEEATKFGPIDRFFKIETAMFVSCTSV